MLYASILGILIILAVVAGYALSQDEAFLTPVPSETTLAPIAPISHSAAYKEGKGLWREHACGSCHNKSMKDDLTGPALGGVTERWSAYPREDLYAWVRSSQQLIAKKHPRALEVWAEWKPYVMANYNLQDEEIEAILSYIEEQYTSP